MKTWFFSSLVIAVVCSVLYLVGYFSIQNNIVGWLNRAQVAGEAKQIHENMVKVQKAMEKNGMTDGYAAYIWRTPDYNMAEIYKAVKAIVNRSEKIASIDQTTTIYQVALDDLRGIIRELDLHAWEYKWRHSVYLLAIIITWLGWISTIYAAIVARL